MSLMRKILFLSLGLVLVYCETTNNNNKNSNGEELNLKGKPNSADSWRESLLSYMELKSPREKCSGGCTRSIDCILRAGDINCRCSFFSCKKIS